MKQYIYTILLLGTSLFVGCQSDSTQPNQNVNNTYAGNWLFTFITADSSSDTLTILNDGNFTSKNYTLINNSGTNYTGYARGRIDNAASFSATVIYTNHFLPFATTLSGYTGATGNYTITLYYNNVLIGTADGSVSNTTFTGSGTFTSPLFNGNWNARRLN